MDLVFDDLNETERRIHELRGDIGYLSLCEILDRQNDRTLVRVDFSVSQLGGYLRDDRPPLSRSERERMPADDEPEEEEDDEDSDDSDDDDRGPRLSDLGVPDSSLPSLEQLARAAMRWIKHTCAGFMVGETVRDFKIRVFSAKGHKTIHARRFTVRDLDRERAAKAPVAAPAPIAVALTPTVVPIKPEPGRSEALPEARAWRALSDGYTNLIGLIQPSYAHLATLQNAALSNQQGEIQQLREGLETLTGELVKLRVGLAEVDQESRAEVAKQERNDGLGKQFISEVGLVGRTFVAGKFGLPPEVAKLTELVTTSPELTSALQDPAVLELLARPEIRAEFGEMLKRTAADQKAAQAAAAKAQAEAAPKAAAPPPPPSDAPPAA